MLRLTLLYANLLVAYYISAKVLKSIENSRNLLLPGPSDAETLTIIKIGLEKYNKSETEVLQHNKVLKSRNNTKIKHSAKTIT